MNAGQAVATYLKTRPAVTAIVAQRIYWPQSEKIQQEIHLRVNELDAGGRHALDVAFPLVQVSAFGKTPAAVAALRDVVIAELRNITFVVDEVFIVCTLQDTPGMFEAETWWHAPMTFSLKYQEA